MNKRFRKSKKQQLSILSLAVLVLLSLFITIAPSLNLPFYVPEWSDLFASAGLSEQNTASQQPMSVHFIDVGQGDCSLVKTQNSAILIDSGELENANTVLDYLDAQGISKLDYIIATHPHSDHIGSMAKIIDKMEVGNIIIPNIAQKNIPTTKTYENFLISAGNSKAKVLSAKPGKEYTVDGITMTILAPITQNPELNNMSVVAKIVYGDTSFLFTGDAEKAVENQLLSSGTNLRANVLKVSHHGSTTSSSKKFIQAVNPEFAVIFCGKDNPYKHPHKEIISMLTDLGVNCKRTDLCGNIVVGSDGKNLYIATEKWTEAV